MTQRQLEVENLFLRHQLNIALRRAPHRLYLRRSDRAFLVWMTGLMPSLLALSPRSFSPRPSCAGIEPDFRPIGVVNHGVSRAGPKIDRKLRDLIRQMSRQNSLWGEPRIHGELLKLGFELAESTVSKYMAKQRGPSSQGWQTFLRNHADAIAGIDLCVVPSLTFERLFAFLVVGHGQRQLLWFAVTKHPTAEWLAQQILEAFPWDAAPDYLVRDNDRAYGEVFIRRIRAMGIRDRPISPRSPWQNPYVERLIGTLRRDCASRICGGCSRYILNTTMRRARTWD